MIQSQISPEGSLLQKTINIIGAGRLGQTFGHLCLQLGLIKINGVCNLSLNSAIAAIDFIGEGTPYVDISSLPHADITVITTPDDRIEHIASALSDSGKIRTGDIFFHCSGVLTSDALIALKAKKAFIACLHPMQSFAEPSTHTLHETYCAIEGDAQAIEVLEPIFQAIGAITYSIEKDKKALYHAAGVFASNYLVTLSQQAIQCLLQVGVDEHMAPEVVLSLMQSTLDNLKRTKSPAKALTGPLQRGDISALQSHLRELLPLPKALYKALGRATLPLTAHSRILQKKLRDLFTKTSS